MAPIEPPAMHFDLALDCRSEVGESCVWDAARSWLWFCDIPAGRLHAFDPLQRNERSWSLPGPVGSFGLCPGGELVVALGRSIVVFHPDEGRHHTLVEIDSIPDVARLNDGKVGPDGCFWVGTVDERNDKQDIGVLYRVRPDGGFEVKADGFKCSNGLAWSSDGRTMYHSDSRGPWIDRWDFDASSGRIGGRKRIVVLDPSQGRPDGAACDAEGRYWSAGVSAGCLNVFDRDGRLLETHPVPVPTPTMPCFTPHGLFVTSLRRGLSSAVLAEHCHAGGLLHARQAPQGAPVAIFGERS